MFKLRGMYCAVYSLLLYEAERNIYTQINLNSE